MQCDNRLGNSTVKCSYTQTTGTKYSTEVQQHFNISLDVQASIEAHFWKIFQGSASGQFHTGYDWSKVSDSTKNEQVTITVEAEAPPGYDFPYGPRKKHLDISLQELF